ncbi:hypothetical protein PSMK_04750 [Phycisphaera mikurensis NBRC 102666]|uniref:PEP-CTERM protein-sorting domain-containing protein n=1 Tax=Phycisphaera mikurensis (strain NBRC 102666 / KCTC 22515 / FYK2301M01) TaxID=1142394 RepID=I0IBJ6_PHYMF|nr:hypothetical protein PSMK_04750 [Phycisphaera mikurensis NBRC 102666]
MLCITGGLLLAGAPARASIDHGAFLGTTVDFVSVTEAGDGGAAVFGTPTASGDVLAFTPDSNFEAVSFNGGSVTRSTSLETVVSGRGSNTIETLQARLGGDIDLNAVSQAGAATAFGTRVAADIRFDVEVLAVDGVDLPAAVLVVSDGRLFEANLAEDGSQPVRQGLFTFDLRPALTAEGIAGDVTRLRWGVTLDLIAESETLTQANLSVPAFSEIVLTVPEPAGGAAVALLGGLCTLRRRPAAG